MDEQINGAENVTAEKNTRLEKSLAPTASGDRTESAELPLRRARGRPIGNVMRVTERMTIERKLRCILAMAFGATAVFVGAREHYWCIPLALVSLMPISQRSVLSQLGRVVAAVAKAMGK